MIREYTAEAATLEDALDAALEALGVQQDAVGYEVLSGTEGRKLFGLGSPKSVKVRVWIKEEALRELAEADADKEDVGAGMDEGLVEQPASSRATAELTDEQIDHIADTASEVVRHIVESLGVEEFEIEEYEGDEGELILDLVGANLAFVIGRHGRTLDALQTAVSAIVTKKTGFHYPITIDIEGYKHRRRQRVIEISHRAAERAMSQNRSVPLKPMTPAERRMVHVALRDIPGVSTASEGSGEYRHVVIVPARR